MKIKKQITVFLENQPGVMAQVCRILKKNKINIHAFTVFGTVDHGVLRLILDNPDAAVSALSQQGILAIESKVIEIEAENMPGQLYEITNSLYKGKVNIEYGYGSTSGSDKKEKLFLQASDNKKAFEILKKKYS